MLTSPSFRYYNSRFDNAENLDIKVTVKDGVGTLNSRGVTEKLIKLSETIANAIFLLASDGIKPKERIKVPANVVSYSTRKNCKDPTH